LFPLGIVLAAVAVARADAPASRQTTTPSQAMVQSIGRWTYDAEGRQRQGAYLAFAPTRRDDATRPPMLIFLHGAGYRGDDLARLEGAELVKQIRAGRAFDALVLCPQVVTYWSGEQAAAFIDEAATAFAGRYDPERVYLTGESAGGGGAWEGAKRRADVLAAVVPIATTLGDGAGADRLVGLPIWAFHNVHDPYQSVTKSRAQVAAVRAAGGRYVFLTEYTDTPGKQHNGIWPNAHRQAWEAAYRDADLWAWLFRQRRGRPELALAPSSATRPRALDRDQPTLFD
jgi:predicted peptidase